MKTLITKLQAGHDLDQADVAYAAALLFSADVEDAAKESFLTALHHKGETAEEIVGFTRLLLERAVKVPLDPAELPGPMIDVCGTGGDGLDLFNVSTTIMFILAAGGAVVVKHGNRSVTSTCGSADVLETLGVEIHLTPEELAECVKRHGLGFLFARVYHPAFRDIAEMRARLAGRKLRTIFNLLGPLLNPVQPSRQLIGVFSARLTDVFGEVLRQLGRERAWVVHGITDTGAGMDDISTSGVTMVADVKGGSTSTAVLDARWLAIPESSTAELMGTDSIGNAATLEAILKGEIQGAKRDLAVVNAAGGFVVAGLARDMNDGIALAREQLDNGAALAKLRALQNYRPKSSR